PCHPSRNFLLDDDDDEDMGWNPSGAFDDRHDSLSPPSTKHTNGFVKGKDREETDEGMAGLRRTPSGMFMPYEEDEDDVVATGLFGKVVDTVNTAKDIAHVIWNVGWRR
ncbi:hypothetical protein LTS18_011647, partial [Coniosporium uncinatum]